MTCLLQLSKGLFADELNGPALFLVRLSIARHLPHPSPIDCTIDLSDLSLTRDPVTGWTLFVEKAKGVPPPRRGEHILVLKVGVKDRSSRGRFIDHSSIRPTARDSAQTHCEPGKLTLHNCLVLLSPLSLPHEWVPLASRRSRSSGQHPLKETGSVVANDRTCLRTHTVMRAHRSVLRSLTSSFVFPTISVLRRVPPKTVY